MEQTLSRLEADRALIDSLGGVTKVAKLLGYASPGGVQRVHNWKMRGIPAAVKLERPDIFMVGRQATHPCAKA